MNQTFKQYLQENTINTQHEQFQQEVMQFLNVTALSPQDRDVVHQGMKTGLSPEDVANQLKQPALEPVSDLPPELDQDPEGMPTGGGMGITGA